MTTALSRMKAVRFIMKKKKAYSKVRMLVLEVGGKISWGTFGEKKQRN